ncbi:MAG: enoyl-CoA hydratase/isomerase family protein [Rhodospirillales bacterium]|nr:enoyl-CoA hydratase/isomerase family protein [Rhodospirillales bacterium]
MSFKTVQFDVAEGGATLTMNRPETLNALNKQLIDDMTAALDQVEADDDIRCLLITGAGRGFCSGADLADPTGSGGDLGGALDNMYNPFGQRLRKLSVPIVAAVNGPCAGAGMSIALAADIIIAGKSASFLQAFANIGLVPDVGATYYLPRMIGGGRAAGMMLLGEKLPAEKAHEWGLVWEVVEDNRLIEAAEKIAKKLGKGPTVGLNLIRGLLDASESNGFEDQLHLEARSQSAAGATDDFKEGVKAFLEKRPAQFAGR